MTQLAYANFDLIIEPVEEDYRVLVHASPAGEATGERFPWPLGEREVDDFLEAVASRRTLTMRSSRALRMASRIEEFGARLFTAVFTGEVEQCLIRSRALVADRRGGLRIRLRIDKAPELSDLPWEYLYDPKARKHLCLSEDTPLVRYLALDSAAKPLRVTGPLRILTVIANPADNRFAALDVEAEWESLKGALAEVSAAGQVQIDRLARPTLVALDAQLKYRGPYHVLHFIGHGRYNTAGGYGELLFENEQGRAVPVPASRLATALDHYREDLRLVVLNACEGARSGLTDPFAGTAQTLMLGGTPAVVAMQFEISDLAAIAFSGAFYRDLSEGKPLDTAVAAARRAIFLRDNEIEWATPVLYTRAADTQVFTVAPGDATALSDDEGDEGREGAEGREGEESSDQTGQRDQEEHPVAPNNGNGRPGRDEMVIDLVKNDDREEIDLDKWGAVYDVVLNWTPRIGHDTQTDFDVDLSMFLLDGEGRVPGKDFVIYYNNLISKDGAIRHFGDDLVGHEGERISVDLSRLDSQIHRIVIAASIHQGRRRRQNFGRVKDTVLTLEAQGVRADAQTFRLSERFAGEVAVTLGELRRSNGTWSFRAEGTPFHDMAAIVERYGFRVRQSGRQ